MEQCPGSNMEMKRMELGRIMVNLLFRKWRLGMYRSRRFEMVRDAEAPTTYSSSSLYHARGSDSIQEMMVTCELRMDVLGSHAHMVLKSQANAKAVKDIET